MSTLLQELAEKEYFGMKLGLEKIQTLLDHMGHPEKKYSSILVAGTNGKGSTAMMMAAILRQTGLKVGLFTSPHLTHLNERFWCDGKIIDDASLERLASTVDQAQKEVGLPEPLTFFEWVTAMIFLWFAEQRVAVAILEVGLGGRLDTTNVVSPDVSVITSIGHDHTEHLGESLTEIAQEKAGIIKSGVPVVCGVQDKSLQVIFQDKASQEGTEICFVNFQDYQDLKIPLLGDHQIQNAGLAVVAAKKFAQQHDIALTAEMIQGGLKNVVWPGRLEWFERQRTLLDVAHNQEAIEVLIRFLQANYNGTPITLIFGAMKEKNVDAMLHQLIPVADRVLLTRAKMRRSLDPHTLNNSFSIPCEVIEDSQQAYQEAVQRLDKNGIILVTGSLFLVGEIRSRLVMSYEL